MKIHYKIVRADTGIMGGILSEEYQAITEIGEDSVIYCDECDYSTNIEVAECIYKDTEKSNKKDIYEKVHTPGYQTIEEVSNYLEVDIKKTVKAVMYQVGTEVIFCFIRGDREINEVKLSKILETEEFIYAEDENILNYTVPGYVGPIGLNAKILVDKEVEYMTDFVVGANEENYHLINANIQDFNQYEVYDLRNITPIDKCPKCGGVLHFTRGIEVANIFKLGTKYAESFNLYFTDEDNQQKPVVMGSYGIGPARCMAAIVEQHHDEKGIVWPKEVTPFQVCIVVVNTKDEEQVNYANELYESFQKQGIETLLDDRDERAGVKFNDMELIGIPVRITVGRGLTEGNVELKYRNKETPLNISCTDVSLNIQKIIDEI